MKKTLFLILLFSLFVIYPSFAANTVTIDGAIKDGVTVVITTGTPTPVPTLEPTPTPVGKWGSVIINPTTKKCNTLITKNGVRTSYGFGYYGPSGQGYNPPEVRIPARQTTYLLVDPFGFGYGVDVLGSNFKIQVTDYDTSHHNLIVTLITTDRDGNDISSSQATEQRFISAGSGVQQYGAKISNHTNNKIYLIEIKEIGGLTVPISVTWAR
jgi:hypothetical protein